MNDERIGCIKGSKSCWDAIKREFPEVFKNGLVRLGESGPSRGRLEDEIMCDCGIMCEINYQDSQN